MNTNELTDNDIIKAFNHQIEKNPLMLREIMEDFVEDVGLKNAIEEGRKSGISSLDEVYKILN